MPNFKFEAIDNKGRTVSGIREAAGLNEIEEWLLNNGMSPIDIVVTQSGKVTADPADTAGAEFTFQGIFSKITIDEKIVLCRQIATMINAGVAVLQALEIITMQTTNPVLKKIILQVAEDIESGDNLSDSFAKFPRHFDTLFQNIIKVGEESGGLGISFEYLSQVFESEKEVTEKIKAATRYPKIVMTSIVGAVTFLMIFVVPKFMSMFKSSKVELPLPTKILIWVSNAFSNYSLLIIGILLVIVAAYQMALKSKDFVRIKDNLFLRIPVMGSLTVKIYMARFCRVFALLAKSGVDIIKTLDLSVTSINNLVIREIVDEVKVDVKDGKDLYESMARHPMFPPMVVQMVSIGEKSGTLSVMMDKVADFYDSETRYSIDNLSSLIEPVLLVVMGIIVGLLALAIYMPMWNMMKVMQ
ncbi:type II secretion system F family protein [Desulfobacterota bacterium M19]